MLLVKMVANPPITPTKVANHKLVAYAGTLGEALPLLLLLGGAGGGTRNACEREIDINTRRNET